jgi:hypothetical protein
LTTGFFLDEFPFLVFIGRDFAAFQKIPEGIIRVNAGVGFGLVFGCCFGACRCDVVRDIEILVVAAIIACFSVFAVAAVATDAENIAIGFVISASHVGI